MDEPKDKILDVLVEIRDTLSRIYTCFEDQYLEIQKKKYPEKVSKLEAIINTDTRKKIFQLMFDKNHLSHEEIADNVGITVRGVNKFIKSLKDGGLIDLVKEDGKTTYIDIYNLLELIPK